MMPNAKVAQQIHDALRPLQVVPLDTDLPGEPTIGRIRRRGRPEADDIGIITLLDVDGVLLWEDGAVNASTSMRRRARGGAVTTDGDVVTQLKYEKPLGLNSIVEKLHLLDGQLTARASGPQSKTPGSALLEYDQTDWTATPCAAPAAAGKILLLVHGTFSNTENIVRELKFPAANGGPNSFLSKVKAANYTQVLGFDHFTVSRTPLVNAVELARLFAQSKAEIHIVCHSRGGLVSRWFCEVLDRKPKRRRRVGG